MSKGQSPKLKGTISNVPVDIVRTCNNPLYCDIDINYQILQTILFSRR